MPRIEPVKTLWKSFKPGMKSEHGTIEWKIGEWFTDKKKVRTCSGGFHASNMIADAMRYVRCDVLALVEVAGVSDLESDKEAWRSMRIVKAYQWDKEASVKMAIFAAELTIDIFEKKYPQDSRPRRAIEVAKAYLEAMGVKQKKAAYAADAAADAADAAAYAAAADADAAADAYAAAYAADAAADAADAAAYAAAADADAAADAADAAAADAADAAADAAAAAAADADTDAYAAARLVIKQKIQGYIINEIIPTLKEYVEKD